VLLVSQEQFQFVNKTREMHCPSMLLARHGPTHWFAVARPSLGQFGPSRMMADGACGCRFCREGVHRQQSRMTCTISARFWR
jgi:hypothetical protein